jgi:hypothetical protein
MKVTYWHVLIAFCIGTAALWWGFGRSQPQLLWGSQKSFWIIALLGLTTGVCITLSAVRLLWQR